MKPYLFVILITVDDAIRLHTMVIDRFGGASGIRDIRLLESALDQPLKVIEYGEEQETRFEHLAATYFFHVIKNHAFIDGNKRTGLLIATTFLKRNRFILDMDFDALYRLALETAESRIHKQDIATLFRAGMKQVD
jgi:death-on-curing protein